LCLFETRLSISFKSFPFPDNLLSFIQNACK
jgi:hypothetical protein